jgi:general stress protein 26
MGVPPILRGVNQRATIRMTEEEVLGYLRRQTQMTFCTHNPDGTIHAVAMAYGFLADGTIAFEGKGKSQKIQNLVRNPQLTVVTYDGEAYDELRGVQLVGRAELSEDLGELQDLARSMYGRYHGPIENATPAELEQMVYKRVCVKLVVDKTISWDHHKLIKATDV